MKNYIFENTEMTRGTPEARKRVFLKYAILEFLKAPGWYVAKTEELGVKYVPVHPYKIRYAIYRLIFRIGEIYNLPMIYRMAGMILLKGWERNMMKQDVNAYTNKMTADPRKYIKMQNPVVGMIGEFEALYIIILGKYMEGRVDRETEMFI